MLSTAAIAAVTICVSVTVGHRTSMRVDPGATHGSGSGTIIGITHRVVGLVTGAGCRAVIGGLERIIKYQRLKFCYCILWYAFVQSYHFHIPEMCISVQGSTRRLAICSAAVHALWLPIAIVHPLLLRRSPRRLLLAINLRRNMGQGCRS